jgi:hypothetical protein
MNICPYKRDKLCRLFQLCERSGLGEDKNSINQCPYFIELADQYSAKIKKQLDQAAAARAPEPGVYVTEIKPN